MHIGHLAIWTRDLERLRSFYVNAFGGISSERYENPKTGFSSYFVSFGTDGARLELMTRPDIVTTETGGARVGYAHLAFTLGSRAAVDGAVARLRSAGIAVEGEPRVTGDGFYEAVIRDPDANPVELVA